MNDAQAKLENVKKKFKNQKKEFVFVGIHSRRTDHINHQLKKNLIPLKPSYYLGKIDFMPNLFSKFETLPLSSI